MGFCGCRFLRLLIITTVLRVDPGALAWQPRPFRSQFFRRNNGGSSGETSMESVTAVTDNIAIASNSESEGVAVTIMEPDNTSAIGESAAATNLLGSIRGLGGGGKGKGRGVLGFLPGLNFGGGGSGKGGLFGGGGGGKGKGLFGGGGSAGGGTKESFPEFPTEGGYSDGPVVQNTATTGNTGWTSGGGDGGSGSGTDGKKGKGLLGNLFRNPFGGGSGGGGLFKSLRGAGGGGGRGRSPFRLLSRLNEDLPCAAGLSTLPIISKLPFVPKNRFPRFVPSGVNTCDSTCDSGTGGGQWRRVPPNKEEQQQMGYSTGGSDSGGYAGGAAAVNDSSCTYNWRDSLTSFPFLLFRCSCSNKCPPKRVKIGGPFNAQCEDVSNKKTRCKCPYGEQSYKCTVSVLPVALPLVNRTKPYYCTCCKDNAATSSGYGVPLGPSSASSDQSGGYSSSGGYSGGGGGGGSGGGGGGRANSEGTSSSENVEQKEVPKGRPLGIEHYYAHL